MQHDATAVEYLCLNPHCLVGRWSVTQEQPEIWRITADFDNHPFLVAAAIPHCPCCGAELRAPGALEQGMEYDKADVPDDEQGPLFDFIRSLP